MTDSKKRLLIIEDNIDDQQLYERFLQDSYEICKAYTGSEGLDIFQKQEFSCVLIDYNLTDYDGLEVLKKIVALDKPSTFVVLTGQGSEDIAVKLLKNGAHDYIKKESLTSEKLRETLKNAIEKNLLKRKQKEQREETYRQKLESLYEEEYCLLILQYMRAIRFNQPYPTQNIRRICINFAQQKKTAKQVVLLHSNALKALTSRFMPDEAKEFAIDARLLLIEVMGILSDQYRTMVWGNKDESRFK